MATGIGIRVPLRFNNPALRKRRDDAILSTGSLVLIDFAHSANPLIGVPVSGTGNIPNIAWKEAAALHGSGTQSDWAMDAVVNASGVDGFIDRSAKGGVNVCMSQATQTGTGKGFEVRRQTLAGNPLLQYLYANRTHNFYFSQWERITRIGLTTNPELGEAAIYAFSSGSPTTTCLLNLNRTTTVNATLGSNNVPALPQAVGNSFRSGGFGGWTATGQPTGAADIIAGLLAVGQRPALYAAGPVNRSRSAIMYRAYLEDLTASGRTYAEVQAMDKALFDQAFAIGGRFYGDTFTALIP